MIDADAEGVSGLQEIKTARSKAKAKEIPVIFVTGYADEDIEKSAQSLNPVAYLYKPFDAFKLLELIKKAVS